MSLFEVKDLSVQFGIGGRRFGRPRRLLKAVDRVSYELEAGQTLAIVGESGSGKSTLARASLALEPVQSGEVLYRSPGREPVRLLELDAARTRALRPELQIVFQNPGASLHPRFRVGDLLGEAPRLHFGWDARELADRVATVLERVGLGASVATRYPHEFSAGQRQRLAICTRLDPRTARARLR